MSIDVKIHETQTSILRELLFLPAAGFAELQKPTGLTSDHFTFHINRLVELGLVERTERGAYRLTTKGKEYANRLDTDERVIERQAKLAVLVVPTRMRDGRTEYLIQERLKQPFYGYYCYLTGKLRWGETVLEGAARELDEETGLAGQLVLKGVHHKIDYSTEGKLLEDKHFFIIRVTELTGELKKTFDGGANYWLTLDEIKHLEKAFEDMARVIEIVEQETLVFWEQSYRYTKEQY